MPSGDAHAACFARGLGRSQPLLLLAQPEDHRDGVVVLACDNVHGMEEVVEAVKAGVGVIGWHGSGSGDVDCWERGDRSGEDVDR